PSGHTPADAGVSAYDLPPPEPIARDDAARIVAEQLALLGRLDVRVARVADAFADGRVAAIVHMEGAEALAADLSDFEEWYGRGLRSLGPVWSRPNDFGEGVPFVFPSSPDTGAGLS